MMSCVILHIHAYTNYRACLTMILMIYIHLHKKLQPSSVNSNEMLPNVVMIKLQYSRFYTYLLIIQVSPR
ncbi:MAG: hypothetical protein FKGGLIKP_00807 [Sodalis sp. Fse]|nr:MAG: hypothetical protein FKGGLIKP_00807 [Sodalis sp. Fse]